MGVFSRGPLYRGRFLPWSPLPWAFSPVPTCPMGIFSRAHLSDGHFLPCPPVGWALLFRASRTKMLDSRTPFRLSYQPVSWIHIRLGAGAINPFPFPDPFPINSWENEVGTHILYSNTLGWQCAMYLLGYPISVTIRAWALQVCIYALIIMYCWHGLMLGFSLHAKLWPLGFGPAPDFGPHARLWAPRRTLVHLPGYVLKHKLKHV